MFLKKTALIGTVIALTLPLVAHASLYTNNNTNKWSTVLIDGTKCAAAGALAKFTTPGQRGYETKDLEIRAICEGKDPCAAQIILSDSEAQVRRCEGPRIGNAKVSLPKPGKQPIITELNKTGSVNLGGKGSNTLDIG